MSLGGGDQGPSVADRMFVVLEECARSGRALSLAELVERTGLPKTTLHRVCWKLVELRVLEHGASGFRVGARLYALGATSPALSHLRVAAAPHLHRLGSGSGWIANLGVICDGRALIVDEVHGARPVAGRGQMAGSTVPLHACAIGKVLLAHADEDVREEALANAMLDPFTRRTVVRSTLLREQLDEIVRSGVAYSREEWRLGTCAVAVPVLSDDDEVVGALALIGPSDGTDLRAFVTPLRRAALALSAELALCEPAVAAA